MDDNYTLISVKDYAQQEGISTQAVYKRIKTNKIKSLEKNSQTYIILDNDSKSLQSNCKPINNQVVSKEADNNEGNLKELQTKETFDLQLKTIKLQTELEAKNREVEILKEKYEKILKVKDDLVISKNETIESQKKTIQALEISYTQLELKYQNQAKLLESKQEPRDNPKDKIIIDSDPQEETKTEKEEIHQETSNQTPPKSPKTENTQIELMEFLKTQGIESTKERKKFRARFNRRLDKDSRISKDSEGKIYLEANQDYSEILKPWFFSFLTRFF